MTSIRRWRDGSGPRHMVSLPGPSRRLISLMQRINFGSIENLRIEAGQPLFEPPPKVLRFYKFGGVNATRPEHSLDDFALKAEVVELLAELQSMTRGVVLSLDIRHGLPFRMTVEEQA